MGKKCDLSVLISVYLWREGERMVRETFVSHHLLTVFQPTEIRTNTGSVSYPKVKGKSKYSRKARTRAREYRDHSVGMTEAAQSEQMLLLQLLNIQANEFCAAAGLHVCVHVCTSV